MRIQKVESAFIFFESLMLQTIAIELFFIPLSGSGQTNTAVGG
jgi:hypothetical protein